MRNTLLNDGVGWPVKYLEITLLVQSKNIEDGSRSTLKRVAKLKMVRRSLKISGFEGTFMDIFPVDTDMFAIFSIDTAMAHQDASEYVLFWIDQDQRQPIVV